MQKVVLRGLYSVEYIIIIIIGSSSSSSSNSSSSSRADPSQEEGGGGGPTLGRGQGPPRHLVGCRGHALLGGSVGQSPPEAKNGSFGVSSCVF